VLAHPTPAPETGPLRRAILDDGQFLTHKLAGKDRLVQDRAVDVLDESQGPGIFCGVRRDRHVSRPIAHHHVAKNDVVISAMIFLQTFHAVAHGGDS